MGWLLAMMKSHLFLAVLAFGLTVVSFAETGSTEASAQQKIILSYFHEVLDGGNADLVEKIFQPDCAIHFGSSNAHGIAGVRGVVENRKTTYSKLSTEIHDIFDSGDRVVVRLTHRATGGGILRSRIGPHDITGKSVTWDAIVIFQLKNGKIAEEWVNRDELGVLLSAGILKRN
jgi:predicted ester cyclase